MSANAEARMRQINLEGESRVTLPMVASFISIDGQFRQLSEFTVAQLRAIREAWTARLIERAEEQRREKARKS